MKTVKKKIMSRGIAVFVIFTMLLTVIQPGAVAFAQRDSSVIYISSAEDLIQLSSDCSLDTWSQGKTVILEDDIDLKGREFEAIPTFGGSFDGGGHTISGLSITKEGSVQGLFRYVQQGGLVKNLNVNGRVKPEGSKNYVGGIAGKNAGTVINCVFSGDIYGKNSVGGIVGKNEEGGVVSGCNTRGTILGERNTGGTAGDNRGLIQKCENSAAVNTQEIDMTSDSTSSESIIDKIAYPTVAENEIILSSTVPDMGGIAGYSGGIIQNCINYGEVGFKHTGYNVGGIAGRQDGYITGCENNGKVRGRKDVGGIVGQMEPYIIIDASSDNLSQMKSELDAMQGLIDRMLDDMDNTSSNISANLDVISGYTDTARDSSQDLADRMSEFMDANIDEINDLSSIISDTIDQMVPVMDDAADVSERLSKAFDLLEDAVDEIEDAETDAGNALSSLKKALNEAEKANGKIMVSFKKISSALKDLADAIYHNSGDDKDEAANAALKNLDSGIQDLAGSVNEMSEKIDSIEQITLSEEFEKITGDDEYNQAVKAAVSEVKNSYDTISDTVSVSAYDFSGAIQGASVDWEKVQQALSGIMSAVGDLKDAASHISSAMENIKNAAKSIKESSEHILKAAEIMGDASHSMSRAFDSLASCFEGLKEIGEDLSEREPIEFVKLGEEFRNSSDTLFDALAGISDGMSALEDEISSSSDVLIQDLRDINNKFNDIMHLLINTLQDLRDGSGSGIEQQYFKDTSESDISATRLGKVVSCENKAAIEGDKNTGGIVGTMAIEFDLDPEEDIFEGNPLNTIFETKAVLYKCINRGEITSKKDCTGGAVGRMDMGTSVYCENYGDVSSDDGDYTGGVVGYSDAAVRNCYSKCSLSGENYIGGIAGSGSDIRNSCSIVNIEEGKEYTGSVVGYAEIKDSEIHDNFFVSEKTAGIDGISYSGKAEPVEYDRLKMIEGIPEEFKAFNITFKAQGKTVEVIPVTYGDVISVSEMPDVPEKEGYYGVWPEDSEEPVEKDAVIEAEYYKLITAVASDETAEGGRKSVAIAEGSFTDAAKLSAQKSSIEEPGTSLVYEQVHVWDIKLTGSDAEKSDNVPLRLLNEDGGKAKVWEYKNGQWKEMDCEKKGQYLCVDMSGTTGTFCVASTGENPLWLKLLIGILACAAAVFAALIIIKKVKKRRG